MAQLRLRYCYFTACAIIFSATSCPLVSAASIVPGAIPSYNASPANQIVPSTDADNRARASAAPTVS